MAAAALAAAAPLASRGEAEPAGRWLVGDLHVHVSPPDSPGHSALTVASAIDAARRARLDFVALTPHLADEVVEGGGGRQERGQELVRRLAAEHLARPPAEGEPAPASLLVVAGWEWTRGDPGHLGIVFADVGALAGRADAAERALAAGALVFVAHPHFGPLETEDALLRAIRTDRRWRPFGEGVLDGPWNAIEVWHDRSAWVERLTAHRTDVPDETRMLARSLASWDAATKATRRRITAIGGSDAHGRMPYTLAPLAATSVRVEGEGEATVDALRRGLLAARVTFGGNGGKTARELTATSDVEGARVGIGESLRARETVTLRWEGRARLIENGEDVGEHEGGATRVLPSPGAFAFWRIEKPRESFSNMIYANLPEPSPKER